MVDLKFTQLSNETLEQAVDEIVHKYGEGFAAAHILEYATPKDSLLHNCLEWNDKKAGHAYRLQQCRLLMHRLTLKEHVGVRSIISFELKEEGRKGYYRTETVMADDELKKQALKQMYRDAISFVKKYENFKELLTIVPKSALETFKAKYL